MPVLHYRDRNTGNWVPLNSKGPAGAPGPTGPTGVGGAQGPTGPTGATGPQGTQGAIGPTGPTGAKGAIGATGPTGQQGSQGGPGPSGAQGPQGPQGPQGIGGPQGPYGDAHDRWRMVRGRTAVPGGSGSPSIAAASLGLTYNATPFPVCTGSTSVTGSTVTGAGVDAVDTQTIWLCVTRSNATNTYVDWATWGTVY